MTVSALDHFDGLIGQRSEGVRWDLCDANLNVLGVLMVSRLSTPRISNDVTRDIYRTADGLIVPARPVGDDDGTHYYAEDLNTLTMRVRPYWLLDTGDEYPLGVFLFADDSESIWSYGSPRSLALIDENLILNQDLGESVAFSEGTSVQTAMQARAAALGFPAARLAIDSTSATFGVPIAWAAGRDTERRVLDSLCQIAGFYPAYISNDGVLTMRNAPDALDDADPTYLYGFGVGAVIAGTIVASNDLLDAPNRYIAVDNSARDAPVVGIFDLPDAAPHSFANRGFRIVRRVDVQGLTDTTSANAAAAAAYASESEQYSWLSFDTPPDPRHDTFDILSFDGDKFRQLAWTLECKPGGLMHHDCRGTYGTTGA